MTIPFIKAHGARNDFLLTWRQTLPKDLGDFAAAAREICDRHTGVGADGWMIISALQSGPDSLDAVEMVMAYEDAKTIGEIRKMEETFARELADKGDAEDSGKDAHAAIELWNSDGSRSEISGNGTRCAAALLIDEGLGGNDVCIQTGAGPKYLRLLQRTGHAYSFEMNMGTAIVEELHASLEDRDCVILNVGNPQCAFLVNNFDFDWVALGARIERHPKFPNRTNVSFVKVVDKHTLDVRFFERGAGETMSSGTGSTGAGAAAVVRGLVEPPVRVLTPAGALELRWNNTDIFLAGPAELVARGEFLRSRS